MNNEVSVKQAYEWVKTGYWNFAEFNAWWNAQLKKAEELAYNEGYDADHCEV